MLLLFFYATRPGTAGANTWKLQSAFRSSGLPASPSTKGQEKSAMLYLTKQPVLPWRDIFLLVTWMLNSISLPASITSTTIITAGLLCWEAHTRLRSHLLKRRRIRRWLPLLLLVPENIFLKKISSPKKLQDWTNRFMLRPRYPNRIRLQNS